MRAVAISLGAVMSLGPVLLAGTAISADWRANGRRTTGTEVVSLSPPPEPLFYGGTLKPITIVGQTSRDAAPKAPQGARCPVEPVA